MYVCMYASKDVKYLCIYCMYRPGCSTTTRTSTTKTLVSYKAWEHAANFASEACPDGTIHTSVVVVEVVVVVVVVVLVLVLGIVVVEVVVIVVVIQYYYLCTLTIIIVVGTCII